MITQGNVVSAVSLLIVDDDPHSRSLISGTVAQPGVEILTATDSASGLRLACRHHPQIIVATPQPGLPEMLERITEMNAGIHVIRLAAHYTTEDGDTESDRPCTPISLRVLGDRVTRLLREIRRQQSLHAKKAAE